jgi:NADPH:quinone reductase-like Zn-dependent oxidoreductase
MQSIVFHEFGDPLAVLRLEESDTRRPEEGEVVVRLLARSINPSDLLVVRGLYGALPSLPATPGLEGMGEIAETGDGVTELETGDRVITFGLSGTWQQMTLAKPDQLIALRDSISDQSAAQFVVNPLSAWIMIVDELGVQPGEWLVQTAASSTIGRIVLQIAGMLGFRTINIVRRREHAAELEALGADAVICSEDEDVEARIRDIAGKQGVRKAIDAVGGDTGARVLRSLAPGGTMIIYGALSMQPLPLEGSRMIFSSVTVKGFWFNRWRRLTERAKRDAVIASMMGAIASGRIVPPVEAEYPLEEFRNAIRHSKQPGRRGKVLLVG